MVTVIEDDHHVGKPEAMKARLRAIQNPKGESTIITKPRLVLM
tara:strand:+ start:895 stop:1023 length:129 start_codon:yes stop_codon:yes gene_type:complete